MKNLDVRVKAAVRGVARRAGYDVTRAAPVRYVSWAPRATSRLASSPARLEELRARYRQADPAVTAHTYWDDHNVSIGTLVDEDGFRDESMYVWQYIKGSSSVKVRRAERQYFTYLAYLEGRDDRGLLRQVEEEGAFGAPMFSFPGRRPVSRDLLDAVNEILYLDRRLGLLDRSGVRVLDVGAGYGRLAHRMSQLVPGLVDYACIDAIPESTYVCERYLEFRQVMPPCRVVELTDAAKAVVPDAFDLAVNIHSFSEMPASAVRYWLELLAAARVPWLLVIPNAPTTIASLEADGERIDMAPVFEEVGYRLVDREPIVADPAAQRLFGVFDHFHMFEWVGGPRA